MKTLSALVLAVLAGFLLFSCSDESTPLESSNNITEAEFYLEASDITPDITESSIETDFQMEPQYSFVNDPYGFQSENKEMRLGKDKRQPPQFHMPLFRIIKALSLTEDQLGMVREQMNLLRECVKLAREEVYSSIQGIVESARLERQIIITAVKNGEITREDAIAQLRALNMRVKTQIEESGVRLMLCERVRDCHNKLFAAMDRILIGEQLEKWNEWKSKLPDNPCEKEVVR